MVSLIVHAMLASTNAQLWWVPTMSDSLKFTFKIIRFSFIFIDDPAYVTAAGQNTFTVGSTNRDDSFAVQCESKNRAGTLYTTSVLNVYGKFWHTHLVFSMSLAHYFIYCNHTISASTKSNSWLGRKK